LSHHAVDQHLPAMALGHVLDDRQPQSGSASFARATAVHPVEAFRQAGQVFCFDAGTGVTDKTLGTAIGQQPPAHLDAPFGGGVTDRIAQQVGDGTDQFGTRTRNFELGARLDHDGVLPPATTSDSARASATT